MSALFLLYIMITEAIYFLLSPILFAWFRLSPDTERLAIHYPRTHFSILVHAASVGEFNGIRQLLLEILNSHPELRILLTTNTKTSRQAAINLHPRLEVMLSPLDILHLRQKQLSRSQPKLILISETEIWPNLMFAASQANIPVLYINARMSQKSLRQYAKIASLIRFAGSSVKNVLAQTEQDRKRYATLFDINCLNAGNLKFNVIQPEYISEDLRLEWGYQPEDKIIVLGSSRPGEEQLLINSYDALKPEIPELKLILVPRHLNRMEEIISLLAERDASFSSRAQKARDIHVIDEMGLLLPAYAICDVAIIGGSFFPLGGHNPLEAAFYGKPIIMGPNYQSCRGSVSKLIKAKAILISPPEQLTDNLRQVLAKNPPWDELGYNAKQVLIENQDALPQHLSIIYQYLG